MEEHLKLVGYKQLDPLARIGLPTMRSTTYIHVSEILYCKGESNQTSVYLIGNKRLLINRTLKESESLLENFGFCRVHKSYMINLQYIQTITRNEIKFVDLTDGSRIKVADGYIALLRGRLYNI